MWVWHRKPIVMSCIMPASPLSLPHNLSHILSLCLCWFYPILLSFYLSIITSACRQAHAVMLSALLKYPQHLTFLGTIVHVSTSSTHDFLLLGRPRVLGISPQPITDRSQKVNFPAPSPLGQDTWGPCPTLALWAPRKMKLQLPFMEMWLIGFLFPIPWPVFTGTTPK